MSITVTDDLGLNAAISAIDLASQTAGSLGSTAAYTIVFANDISLTAADLSNDLTGVVLGSGSSLTINGNGHTLDGGDAFRGVFAYQGALDLQNLTIADGHAVGGAGGSGDAGGGGGAGLGGGLFVAGAATVALSNVRFVDDAATGGAGGAGGGSGVLAGGGGGLGGAGGAGTAYDNGGGGGIGQGATGGSGTASGAAGILPGAGSGASGSGATASGGGKSGGGGGAGSSDGGGGGPGAINQNGAGSGGGGGGGGNRGYSFLGGAGGGILGGDGFGGLALGGDVFVQQGGALVITGGALAAGTVQGGLGQAGAQPGFGNGLFIEGYQQSVTLASVSGRPLDVSGVIADLTGSGGSGAGTVDIAGGGTVSLDAANTYSGGTELTGGTALRLGMANAVSDSAGSGPIGIADAAVLQVPGSIANAVTLFDGVLDDTGLAYVAGASATLGNDTLTVTSGARSDAFTLGRGVDGPFVVAGDAAGGTEILSQSITVTDDLGLNAAIREIDLATQNLGSVGLSAAFTIDLANNITLTPADLSNDLTGVVLGSRSSLTINGEGDTLDGGGSFRGLFAYQGTLAVDNLQITRANAVGGAGGSGDVGGGGGAGLGGGLFVAAAATVTLNNVVFLTDSATGGAGGSGDVAAMRGQPVAGGGGLGGAGGDGGGGIGQSAAGADVTTPSGPGILPGTGPGGSTGSGGAGSAVSGGGGGFGVPTANGAGYGGGGTGASGPSGGFGGGGASQDGIFGAMGGFGGGGGGTGVDLGDSGIGGFGGGGGANAAAGFGGGVGGGGSYPGGGGGLGAGGDIFVQQGGALIITDGVLATGSVNPGLAGASVPGSTPSGDGAAVATGLFIQGNDSVTLAPGGGQTLVIVGSIVDERGSGGTGTNAASGTLVLDGLGTVVIAAHNTPQLTNTPTTAGFTGGILLQSGTLQLAYSGAAGSGALTFSGDPTLEFTAPSAPAVPIDNFLVGDTLEVMDFVATGSAYVGNLLTLDSAGGPLALDMPGLDISDLSYVVSDGNTFVQTEQTLCYVAGTRIATPAGDRPVETLRAGDTVFAADPDGRCRTETVCWVATRRLDLAAHPDPELAAPIRLRAGAFGPGLPKRDLRLSPDHCVLADGHLLRAFRLLNGVSVVQERTLAAVTYVHVALRGHALLLAEGLLAESYLDEGFAGFFTGELPVPGPLLDRQVAACAPWVPDDAFAERIWRRVAARASAVAPSARDTQDGSLSDRHLDGLRLIVAGRGLRPAYARHQRHLYALPRATREIRLVSAAARPTQRRPWVEDRRRLGVKLAEVTFDGARIPLDGPQALRGWWPAEPNGASWTDGDACLAVPAGTATLELRLTD